MWGRFRIRVQATRCNRSAAAVKNQFTHIRVKKKKVLRRKHWFYLRREFAPKLNKKRKKKVFAAIWY